MDTTTINGLHSCKPGNDPVVGQVKLFVIEHRQGKSGKPYIKIKSANAENGGTPHRILGAEKTDFVDKYGNHSYNLEVEASSSAPTAFANARATMQQGEEQSLESQRTNPPNTPRWAVQRQENDNGPMSKDDYWRRKEDRDEERQRFIIRQHSQSMALEVLKLKVTLNELTVADLTPAKLTQLSDYFDRDVESAACPQSQQPTTVKPIQKEICTCENTDGDNPLCPIHST